MARTPVRHYRTCARTTRTFTVLAIITILSVSFSPVLAETLTVPVPYPTIQSAIIAAVDGDEIIVASGTYNESINFSGKAIRLRSSEGPSVTIVDATGLNTRVVTCNAGEGPKTILEGFTITGGTAPTGAGMYIASSSPTITNCVFSGNTASDDGGGIANIAGHPMVSICTFSGNFAGDNGGGIFSDGAVGPAGLSVSDCKFIGNTGPYGGGGGGMCVRFGASTINYCTFLSNSAEGGGGFYGFVDDTTMNNCTFNGNYADWGGGLLPHYSNFTATNCTITGNAVDHTGGGQYNFESNVSMINCVYYGNSASAGAGLLNYRGSNSLTNCTFSRNTAVGPAGAGAVATFDETSVVLDNCIFWADSPNEIVNVSPATTIAKHCNLGGGLPSNVTDGGGNIFSAPHFVNADCGNLRLLPDSPCIDAGDNNAPGLGGIIIDLDGNPRFVDDPSTDDTGSGTSPIIDIGAFEFQPESVRCDPADVNCDGAVGVLDLLVVISGWGPCESSCPPSCPADVAPPGGDCTVGVLDLLFIINNWG